MSEDKRQFIASVTAISATILYSGGSHEFCKEIEGLMEKTFLHSGLPGFSLMIKGWSKAVRALLSNNTLDTTSVGYCKSACNSVFALRRAGLSQLEISQIVQRFDGVCGIPPIVFAAPIARGLIPDAPIEDLRCIVPFANIGRCAPSADGATCTNSIRDFFTTTSKSWLCRFDFTRVSVQYAELCASAQCPAYSRWEATTRSSFEYSRKEGGKLGETIDKVVNEFTYLTVGDLIPTRPEHPLLDIFGNVVLVPEEWDGGSPISDAFYPGFSSRETALDQRFGLFGVLWALLDLRDLYPDDVSSDSSLFLFGESIPRIRFSGSIISRLTAQPEEGWKARVVTITPLSIALLQTVLRHVLDPFIRADPLVQVGLLSKVKLYDLMFKIHGSRDGIADSRPSFFYESCESADLTTATDSPYVESVRTIVRPFVKGVLLGKLDEFSDLVLDLGLSPREFLHVEKPPDWAHRCGIMMGEGLSGVYLNTMSGIVRCLVRQMKVDFDFYTGVSSEDADGFIGIHSDLIQFWLDHVEITQFDQLSSQSGDDLVMFGMDHPGELRRYLVLLYRVLGLIPSASTFYSSGLMGTFTEEFCVRNGSTLGWSFIDVLKPRLFLPMSTDGVDSILSRVRQISSNLRYHRNDIDLVYRVGDSVDLLLEMNPMLRDRIERYGIVKPIPSFLGGLDHPIQYSPDSADLIPFEDQEYIRVLSGCSEVEFLEIKYHWVFEDLDKEDSQSMRELMRLVYSLFLSLETDEGPDIYPLLLYPEENLLDRRNFAGYASYSLELRRLKSSLGLATLDEIISDLFSALRFRLSLHGDVSPEINPLIKLRNRREFLISKARSIPDPGGTFSTEMVQSLRWRFQTSYRGKVTQKAALLDVLALDSLPTLTLPVRPFDRWGGL